MSTAEAILVVILGATLAIFLLLAIVATIKTIQILDHLKRITEKAEHIADQAEAVSDFFQKSAGPIAIGRLIAGMAETVFQNKHHKKSKSRGDNDA